MLFKSILLLAILLSGLVMGVLWGTWVSLSRSIESFSAELFLGIGKQMIKNLAAPMRVLMISMVACNIGVCYWLFHLGHTSSGQFALLGAGLSAGVLIITVALNVPLDLQIKKWDLQNLPADWQLVRKKWERFHAIRTTVSVAGFVAMVAAAVVLAKL